MNKDDFCLVEDTISFIDTNIVVYPVYGWGWEDAPPSFEIQLKKLYSDEFGKYTGGLGKIISKKHQFMEFWLVFFIRHMGIWDFINKRPHCDIYFFKNRPKNIEEIGPKLILSQSVGGWFESGYAVIGRPIKIREKFNAFKRNFVGDIITGTIGLGFLPLLMLSRYKKSYDFIGLGLNLFILKAAIFWIGLIIAAYFLYHCFF